MSKKVNLVGRSGSDVSSVSATASDILEGKTIVGPTGETISGIARDIDVILTDDIHEDNPYFSYETNLSTTPYKPNSRLTIKPGGEFLLPSPAMIVKPMSLKSPKLSELTSSTATAADIMKGKTAWVNGVKIVGGGPVFYGENDGIILPTTNMPDRIDYQTGESLYSLHDIDIRNIYPKEIKATIILIHYVFSIITTDSSEFSFPVEESCFYINFSKLAAGTSTYYESPCRHSSTNFNSFDRTISIIGLDKYNEDNQSVRNIELITKFKVGSALFGSLKDSNRDNSKVTVFIKKVVDFY